jgi:hypothetical protein
MTTTGTESTESAGRFTEEAMTAVMHTIANRLAVPADDASLLRLTNNAVFALPTAGLVIRITRSHSLHARVTKVVNLAHWFAQINAPTIRLTTTTQPLQENNLLATVWHYIPPAPTPTVEDLGRVLREFDNLGPPPFPLPTWDPAGDARARLADAEALDNHDHEFLLEWCDRLEPRIADLNERTQSGLIHGDAHVGNLLREPTGRIIWCDFDATCTGPALVDLVAVPVGEARFKRPGTHRRLANSYGYDVTTDPDWALLREARELKMVAAAVPLLASTPGAATEFTTRLRSIQHGDLHAHWTPFANL